MLKVLDLFSGVGGFSLGLESTGGFETVAFCEFDKAAQKVLKLRWPHVPIFEDIRGLDEKTVGDAERQRGSRRALHAGDNPQAFQVRETDTLEPTGVGQGNAPKTSGRFADIITGGFPCQPFSVAGARAGKDDNRFLWPELLRVIQLVQPTWCILENVRGLLSIDEGMVFENCLLDLEAAGYEHQTLVIPACAVNAQHRRDRVFFICHANNSGSGERLRTDGTGSRRSIKSAEPSKTPSSVAHTDSERLQGRQTTGNAGSIGTRGDQQPERCAHVPGATRPTQPRLGRELNGLSRLLDESGLPKVSSGVPKRVDRLKQLGNSIVPQIAAIIGHAILESEAMTRTNA